MKPIHESTEGVRDANEDAEMIESASERMESIVWGVTGEIDPDEMTADEMLVWLLTRIHAWRDYGDAMEKWNKKKSNYAELGRRVIDAKMVLKSLGEWPKGE